uniref:Uncharacterized protein n=1 Tax=Leishmania guyanensis TaxID=5670 RepID=A0A1E1J324_LEIGU|nr:Hypothetical protein BN36_3154670 [Leishmania guyanensis]
MDVSEEPFLHLYQRPGGCRCWGASMCFLPHEVGCRSVEARTTVHRQIPLLVIRAECTSAISARPRRHLWDVFAVPRVSVGTGDSKIGLLSILLSFEYFLLLTVLSSCGSLPCPCAFTSLCSFSSSVYKLRRRVPLLTLPLPRALLLKLKLDCVSLIS